MDYQAHYDRIINRARGRVLEGYQERHHIVPRCMSGNDNPENLVSLTAEEHFVAHQLLVKIYPDHVGLKHAVIYMTANGSRQRRNKLYGWLRKQYSEARRGSTPWNKGKKGSQVAWNKGISTGTWEDVYGEQKAYEMRNNHPLKGRSYLDIYGPAAASQKRKRAVHNRKRNSQLLVCNQCGREGKGPAMYRYHFDRCTQGEGL